MLLLHLTCESRWITRVEIVLRFLRLVILISNARLRQILMVLFLELIDHFVNRSGPDSELLKVLNSRLLLYCQRLTVGITILIRLRHHKPHPAHPRISFVLASQARVSHLVDLEIV